MEHHAQHTLKTTELVDSAKCVHSVVTGTSLAAHMLCDYPVRYIEDQVGCVVYSFFVTPRPPNTQVPPLIRMQMV
jgi:hypothetical protein